MSPKKNCKNLKKKDLLTRTMSVPQDLFFSAGDPAREQKPLKIALI